MRSKCGSDLMDGKQIQSANGGSRAKVFCDWTGLSEKWPLQNPGVCCRVGGSRVVASFA